jgi:hypothetical protein
MWMMIPLIIHKFLLVPKEYFLSVAENTLPQDSNTNNNINAGISDIKDKHSSTVNSDLSH